MSGYVCIAMLEDPPYNMYLAATDKKPKNWCAGLPLPCHLLFWEVVKYPAMVANACVAILLSEGISASPDKAFPAKPYRVTKAFLSAIAGVSSASQETNWRYFTDDPEENSKLNRIHSLGLVARNSKWQDSAIAFRHHWQEYLNVKRAYILSVPSSISEFRNAASKRELGSQAAEYLEMLDDRQWLTESDYVFIQEFLLAGNQAIYDGYVERLQTNRLPAKVRDKALNL